MNQVLAEAKRLIDHVLSSGEDLNEIDVHIIEKACELIDVECQCDYYNGFHCGCEQRNGWIQLAKDGLREIEY